MSGEPNNPQAVAVRSKDGGVYYNYRSGRRDKVLLRLYLLHELYKTEYSGNSTSMNQRDIEAALNVPRNEIVPTRRYLEMSGWLRFIHAENFAISRTGIDTLEDIMQYVQLPIEEGSDENPPPYFVDFDPYHEYLDSVKERALSVGLEHQQLKLELKQAYFVGTSRDINIPSRVDHHSHFR